MTVRDEPPTFPLLSAPTWHPSPKSPGSPASPRRPSRASSRGRLRRQRRHPRARVLDAARELDYVPNALARGLLKSHVPVVGVIVHDITDPYFAEVVRGVEDAAAPGGLPGHHLQLRPRRGARERLCPAAAIDARGRGDVRRQRPGRTEPQRGDRKHVGRDAGLRRGRGPPLAICARRARGRRRQRRRDRRDGRRRWSASGIDGSRSSPARARCTSPGSGSRGIAAVWRRPASRSTSDRS